MKRFPNRGRWSAPDLSGDFYRQAQLLPLLIFGKDVALFGAGEATLRAEAKLIESDIFLRLADAPFDVVFLLQRSGFRRDQAQHDLLLALWHEAERLEAAGAAAVIFEEI